MSKTRLSLLGVVTFAVALVATLPASRLLASAQTPALQIFGIDGTLASGSIQGIGGNHRPLLENLNWKLAPAQLLLLRLGFEVSGAAAGAGDAEPFTARLSVSPLGRWRARDFKGGLGLHALAALAGQAYLPLEGNAAADFSELSWKPGQPLEARGTLRLTDLRWTLAQAPLALGDFEAVVTPKGDTLEVKLSALSGPLEVTGEATYKADRSYEAHIQLRPKPGADPALQNLLRTLGPPDTQAWYHLRRNGTL